MTSLPTPESLELGALIGRHMAYRAAVNVAIDAPASEERTQRLEQYLAGLKAITGELDALVARAPQLRPLYEAWAAGAAPEIADLGRRLISTRRSRLKHLGIRPNVRCPCGSGKKFKKCHGLAR